MPVTTAKRWTKVQFRRPGASAQHEQQLQRLPAQGGEFALRGDELAYAQVERAVTHWQAGRDL